MPQHVSLQGRQVCHALDNESYRAQIRIVLSEGTILPVSVPLRKVANAAVPQDGAAAAWPEKALKGQSRRACLDRRPARIHRPGGAELPIPAMSSKGFCDWFMERDVPAAEESGEQPGVIPSTHCAYQAASLKVF